MRIAQEEIFGLSGGIGREMGLEGFEEYLQTRSVAVPG